MNIILLSGGSGKRLWPLSNDVRSKQFLKIFKLEDGHHESMVQRMYRMIREVDSNAVITIATSDSQVPSIVNQLGDNVKISIEPCRRDTFPAIALAVAYLHDVEGVSENEAIVVCPVDPYVEKPYFETIAKLQKQAESDDANLYLIGIEPTYPSEKYGYIIPKNLDSVSDVVEFKEKPTGAVASEYIKQGALWNAGVFAFKPKYILDISKKVFGSSSYKWLLDNYASLTKISFDYAVVEREPKIKVMRFSGEWKDLGTWNTLTEAMSDELSGNAIANGCSNTHIINELQIPLVALGVNNLAIAATPDGILVTAKESSDKLKDFVPDQRPMHEKRLWGEYLVLDSRTKADGTSYLTKHLIIASGKHISYQRHSHRTEMWTIVDGSGKLIIDGVIKPVCSGDTVCIKPGVKHAIIADTELHIIEVQIGGVLTEDDIERFDWNWDQEL